MGIGGSRVRIRLKYEDGALEMAEPNDFTSFVLTGCRPDGARRRAMAGAGIYLTDDGNHGFVTSALIERLAAAKGVDASWRGGFLTMVAYARRKGWADDEGRLRAHTEWDTETNA